MKSNNSTATLRADTVPKAEQVREVNPSANKGLCTELASANTDGNPKKRTTCVWGGPTVPGTGEDN